MTADPVTPSWTLALSPRGNLRIETLNEPMPSGLNHAIAERLRAAFEQGSGPGLLELGAVAGESGLPPVLGYFRGLARQYLSALCVQGDLEEHRKGFHLEPPLEALAGMFENAPPFLGAEYLSPSVLEGLWSQVEMALHAALDGYQGSVEEFLKERNPAWNLVGRVHFHLAEQKREAQRPFAFLVTYTTRLGQQGKPQHLPLGKALSEYAGQKNKKALLALLKPLHAAKEKSPFLASLVDSEGIYHPLAWSPGEAYRFLKDIPLFEESGIVVKVPDWWRRGRVRRPQVSLKIGDKKPSRLGLKAMLDFKVELTLDGKTLTEAEWAQIRASQDGLALLRGQWVEVDPVRLQEVLSHWESLEARTQDGLSFAEAMRALSGLETRKAVDEAEDETENAWTNRIAGPWLAEVLKELRAPGAFPEAELARELKGVLRPYQEVGLGWLWTLNRLGLGGCLADDMGLGKTLQVLSLLLVLRKSAKARPSLLICPASLLGNWTAEIDRFTPSLRALVAHPSTTSAKDLAAISKDDLGAWDLIMTTYAYVQKLDWARDVEWELIVLDEAQAIKNPSTQQTKATKALTGRCRLALTGTPVENRLSDLWSIFDFINPGLLGSTQTFGRYLKNLERKGGQGYGPLRSLIRPYILRRLKSDRSIIQDLPEKTELKAYCGLSKPQVVLYEKAVKGLAAQIASVEGIQRRGVILSLLTQLKQICNHPALWLQRDAFDPGESGKFLRLRELCESLAERQEKVLVFTQYQQMTGPLAHFLAGVFGHEGLVLHGGIPVGKRRGLVERFQEDEGVPFFVISLKAGGTGLNLTAASHVIHFDRWWNPAVEDQATDRAFRIGQRKNVLVHKFVCRGTIEEKIDAMIDDKRSLSREVLGEGQEISLTELSDSELMKLVSLDIHRAMGE